MQQRDLLRKDKNMDNPRDAIIDDLITRIRGDIQTNASVIVMGDFNECIDSREGTHQKLVDIGLVNMMERRLKRSLPTTWNRGRAAIDHVYMTIDVMKSVRKAGYAPFDSIALSDHRGIFFDLDMGSLFDEELHATMPAQFCRLQSSQVKRVVEYNKLFQKEWDHHKIDKKLDSIAMSIKSQGPTEDNVLRLNNLDSQITDIMKYSEKNCTTISRHCTDPWSPKLKEISREIRYIIVRIKKSIREHMGKSLVDGMHFMTNLYNQLKEKRKEYREFIKKAAAHREHHLDERAQHHVMIGKNHSAASEIKRLKHIEVQKQDS